MSQLASPEIFDHGFTVGKHYEWIESATHQKVSELGKVVATILARSLGGIYNISGVQKADWTNERFIRIALYGGLSSYDSDRLTRLLVLCHDACIRLEINPCNMRYLELVFHPRSAREGRMFDRHPTLESATASIRNREGRYD